MDEKRTHPADAEHGDEIAGTGVPLTERMERDRHRLDECGAIVVETEVAHRQTDRGRHRDVLGERPVALQTDGEVVVAEVRESGPARRTSSARDAGAARHERAVTEPFHAWSTGDDPSAELVAGDDRPEVSRPWVALDDGKHHRPVVPLGSVRSADAGGVDLEQDLAGSRVRNLDVTDSDVARAVVYGGSHPHEGIDSTASVSIRFRRRPVRHR